MNDRPPDMRRDALLRRALVPKGYRPTTASDIEKLLDMIDEEPITEEKKQRMLRKIDGLEPLFPERKAPVPEVPEALTSKDRQLIALHRAQNNPLPPELEAKLKAMERRASNPPDSGGNADAG